MAARGVKLNAEKEKLQLSHEENELKEQLQVLNDRLEHFEQPGDENAVKNQTKAINGLRAELADAKEAIETLNNKLKQINDNDADSTLIASAHKLDQLLDDKLVSLENQAEYYNVVNQCRDEADWAGERRNPGLWGNVYHACRVKLMSQFYSNTAASINSVLVEL